MMRPQIGPPASKENLEYLLKLLPELLVSRPQPVFCSAVDLGYGLLEAAYGLVEILLLLKQKFIAFGKLFMLFKGPPPSSKN